MVAQELIDEVEVLVGAVDAVAAEELVDLDEVHAAAGDDAAYTAQRGGHRGTGCCQDAHPHHAGLATGGACHGGELANGAGFVDGALQLFVDHFLLVHDEEDAVFPAVVPGDEEVGHVAQYEEEECEQDEHLQEVPRHLEAGVSRAAHDDHIEQIDDAEADGQHPIDVEEDAGVGKHGDVVHPPVFAVWAKHWVRRSHSVVVFFLLSFCHIRCKDSANRMKNQIYLSFSEVQPIFSEGKIQRKMKIISALRC